MRECATSESTGASQRWMSMLTALAAAVVQCEESACIYSYQRIASVATERFPIGSSSLGIVTCCLVGSNPNGPCTITTTAAAPTPHTHTTHQPMPTPGFTHALHTAPHLAPICASYLSLIQWPETHRPDPQPPTLSTAAHAGDTAARLTVTAVGGSGYGCPGDATCSGFVYNICCDSYPQFTVNGGPQVGSASNKIDDNDNPVWNLAVSDGQTPSPTRP